jgi:RNA polymerase sigma-70 factor (ECF subfamily)
MTCDPQTNGHLSQISTLWTVVGQAHSGSDDEMARARGELLELYRGAAYRYLLGALRDQQAAEDLCQEFALRFLRGDFRRADPQKGRFRDFVKTALYRMVIHHLRRQYARPLPLGFDVAEGRGDTPGLASLERDFLESWREELLARAWGALAEVERITGQPFYGVLRLRVERPELPSLAAAEELSRRLGRPLTAAGVRQVLHRARVRFADLLLGEVARSLGRGAAAELEQELSDLKLLKYCRPALQKYRGAEAKRL